MGKIIKCRNCGEILARLETQTGSFNDFTLYTFQIRQWVPWGNFEIVCSCGCRTPLGEIELVEEKEPAEAG